MPGKMVFASGIFAALGFFSKKDKEAIEICLKLNNVLNYTSKENISCVKTLTEGALKRMEQKIYHHSRKEFIVNFVCNAVRTGIIA